MNKIPVGRTISHAYSFAFTHYLTILQLTWLPLLITYIATYFLMPAMASIYEGLATHHMGPVMQQLPLLLAIEFVIVLMFLMQFAAILPYALGIKTDVPTFSFPLGKPFWRLFLASVIASLISLAILIAAGVLGGVTGGIVATMMGATKDISAPNAAASIARYTTPITATFVYGALLVVGVRQIFLLAPVVISEERLGLGRPWALSRRNFWRICAIILAILLPPIVLEVIYQIFFVPDMLGHADKMKGLLEAANVMRGIQAYWYVTYPLFALLVAFFNGLASAAQSYAYRAVAPLEKAEDVF